VKHAAARPLLPEYALGLLDAEAGYEVRRHLQGCDACRSEADGYIFAAGALSAAAAADPWQVHGPRPAERTPPGAVARIAEALLAAVASVSGQEPRRAPAGQSQAPTHEPVVPLLPGDATDVPRTATLPTEPHPEDADLAEKANHLLDDLHGHHAGSPAAAGPTALGADRRPQPAPDDGPGEDWPLPAVEPRRSRLPWARLRREWLAPVDEPGAEAARPFASGDLATARAAEPDQEPEPVAPSQVPADDDWPGSTAALAADSDDSRGDVGGRVEPNAGHAPDAAPIASARAAPEHGIDGPKEIPAARAVARYAPEERAFVPLPDTSGMASAAIPAVGEGERRQPRRLFGWLRRRDAELEPIDDEWAALFRGEKAPPEDEPLVPRTPRLPTPRPVAGILPQAAASAADEETVPDAPDSAATPADVAVQDEDGHAATATGPPELASDLSHVEEPAEALGRDASNLEDVSFEPAAAGLAENDFDVPVPSPVAEVLAPEGREPLSADEESAAAAEATEDADTGAGTGFVMVGPVVDAERIEGSEFDDDESDYEEPPQGGGFGSFASADIPSPEAGRPPARPGPSRRWLGRRDRRRHATGDDGGAAPSPAGDDAAPTSYALIPVQHRLVQRRGTYVGVDEDPRALVSFDEEIRRLARPVTRALVGPGGFALSYIPGPVEWGLERYTEEDEEEELAGVIDHDGLVSSNWRFWTIMLAIFSAVLFGILVVGYFFVRDLNTETQQLEVAQQSSAQFIRFRVVTRHPDYNTRGEGYIEKGTGRALLSFGGLPPIERTQRYIVWADTGLDQEIIGSAAVTGGSSQYIEARDVPEGVVRIFVTVETPVEGEAFAGDPSGTVLLEADVPE
jgi:hypothetical protein